MDDVMQTTIPSPLTGDGDVRRIGEDEIREAAATLAKYKQGKSNLELRVVEDELWYKLRHWQAIGRSPSTRSQCAKAGLDHLPEPTSAWLFNSIANKHADAMDNIPTEVVLPRERSDEASAKVLSSVLPAVMELNGFESTYSTALWDKLKHGTAIYGVFWDTSKDNGLGDITIKELDLLRVFWEPGIKDIQRSRNLFITELVDNDLLEAKHPELRERTAGSVIDVAQYVYDDAVDTSDKSLVVDWYYKRRLASGKAVLHYCKFVGDTLLYASENDPVYAARGYYDHGQYPVVFDVLFPEEGTPCGWGYVALCKDPQLYIDKLYGNILAYSDEASLDRWFIASSSGVNKEQFLDKNQKMVEVESSLDDTKIRQIVLNPLSPICISALTMKIDELKETSSNRDVTAGGTSGGVTAASAIAALQEAGNKWSRDMISASYRAHTKVCELCVELMRQFYDEERSFRIIGEAGAYDFVTFSGASIREQPIGVDTTGAEMYRLPVFDYKITAQKKNPFSKMEQNERAKELYGLGFFDPARAQEALTALEMMDFEGIDKVRERVEQGQTLYNLVQKQAAIIAQLTGAAPAVPEAQPITGAPAGDGISSEIMRANTPMTSYGQRLAERSTPHMEEAAT